MAAAEEAEGDCSAEVNTELAVEVAAARQCADACPLPLLLLLLALFVDVEAEVGVTGRPVSFAPVADPEVKMLGKVEVAAEGVVGEAACTVGNQRPKLDEVESFPGGGTPGGASG